MGLRKLTLNHLLASRLAEQAEGLPAGVKHPNQLLGALRRAAPYLGLTRLLPLMDTLFRWTQAQDWAPDAEPVVWPSNAELALALDCSERHVSRLIAAAIEARLIAARDGSDRKRRGWREQGRIVWAWGLNLRPMAARHAEFLAAAAAGEAARRQCQLARREARALGQSLAQLLELARDQAGALPRIEAALAEAAPLLSDLRAIEDATALARRVAALRALVAAARGALESGEMSGSPDLEVRPIIPTTHPPEPQVTPVAALPRPLTSTAGEKAEEEEGLLLSAPELARLAPRLSGCLAGGRPDWAAVSDAAARLAGQLGIPSGLYGQACRQLGRRPAAVAVAVISTKPEGHFRVSGPGGYLHGMLRRAARGELHLDRSIFGLRQRAGG